MSLREKVGMLNLASLFDLILLRGIDEIEAVLTNCGIEGIRVTSLDGFPIPLNTLKIPDEIKMHELFFDEKLNSLTPTEIRESAAALIEYVVMSVFDEVGFENKRKEVSINRYRAKFTCYMTPRLIGYDGINRFEYPPSSRTIQIDYAVLKRQIEEERRKDSDSEMRERV